MKAGLRAPRHHEVGVVIPEEHNTYTYNMSP